MKNLSDFFELFRKKIEKFPYEALALVDELRNTCSPSEFESYMRQEVDLGELLNLRSAVSCMFEWRIRGIQTEAMFEKLHKTHAETIQIFDDLAWEHGFKIVEKRRFVSFVEMARDQGIIQVRKDGVSLTPKGERIAEEVRKEIEGE